MKFSHVSDTHTNFPAIPNDSEFIVHSGDMLADMPYSDIEMIKKHQYIWLEDNVEAFKRWIDGRKFYFCAGNHDWLNSEAIVHIMNMNGINAIDISNKLVVDNDITFYGNSYINYIAGYWNYELHENVMRNNINYIGKIIQNTKVDILVSHSPIYKILDKSGQGHYGIKQFNTIFNYLPEENFPQFFLTGHIHASCGLDFTTYPKMIISNAATTHRQLEFIK